MGTRGVPVPQRIETAGVRSSLEKWFSYHHVKLSLSNGDPSGPLQPLAQVECPNGGVIVGLPGLDHVGAQGEVHVVPGEGLVLHLGRAPAVGDALEAAPDGTAVDADLFDGFQVRRDWRAAARQRGADLPRRPFRPAWGLRCTCCPRRPVRRLLRPALRRQPVQRPFLPGVLRRRRRRPLQARR